jgi:hypothetical protein
MAKLIGQDPRAGLCRRKTAKTTVEACRSIDIGSWTRAALLQPGPIHTGFRGWRMPEAQEVARLRYTIDAGRQHVRLQYSDTKTGKQLDYLVGMAFTQMHCGAQRWCFVCRGCSRHVRKLYLPLGGIHFGCRQCWQLSYTSQGQNSSDRAMARALAIRKSLRGSASLTDPFPAKPKGMWRKKYRRLCSEAEECLAVCGAASAPSISGEQVDRIPLRRP